MDFLNERLILVSQSLISFCAGQNIKDLKGGENNILTLYKSQDVAGKRYIIELFTPISFYPLTTKLNPLKINQAISMIINFSDQYITGANFLNTKTINQISNSKPRFFSDRRVSVNEAMKILKKNDTETSLAQVKEILDLLYPFTKVFSNREAQNI